MPVYEYECEDCGYIQEEILEVEECHKLDGSYCPKCVHGEMHKIISNTSFRLGRSGKVGWADTGYGDNVVGNTEEFKRTGQYTKR